MTAPAAARTRILDHTYHNGYVLRHGPIVDVQSGVALKGGRNKDEITATNLNNSGSGSPRQGLADALTAGGGWVDFAAGVNGTCTLATEVAVVNPTELTLDGRGNDISFDARGILWDTSGSSATTGHLLVINVRMNAIASSGNDQMRVSSDSRNLTPFAVLHVHWRDFNSTDGDEALDIYVGSPQSHGIDGLVAWNWFQGVTDGSKKKMALLFDNPPNALANLDKFRVLLYRNHYDSPNFRTPLCANDASTTNRAYLAMLEDYTRWIEDGQSIRGYFNAHALNCTYDARSVGNIQNASDGSRSVSSSNNGQFANLRIDGERVIESSSFPGVDTTHPRNPGSVTDMRDLWDGLVVESAGSTHDAITIERHGNPLQLRQSGTIEGESADDLVGKTFIVDLPSTRAWDGSLDDTAQRGCIKVLNANMQEHPTISGTDIFTSDDDVARTDSTTITFTASANVTTAERIYLVWAGSQDLVAVSGKVSYLEGYNPIAIEPNAGGGTHSLAGEITSASALSGSLIVIAGTPGTASIAVRGSIRNATELDIRRGGVVADIEVLGGRNLQMTLTTAMKEAIVAGMSAATSPRFGWNNVVRDELDADTYVTRISDTVVRVGPLPAFTSYDVAEPEQVTITFPEIALA